MTDGQRYRLPDEKGVNVQVQILLRHLNAHGGDDSPVSETSSEKE